jgi:hypothetical protein
MAEFRLFKIPEGYHRRESGAATYGPEPMPCDVCHRPSLYLTGYEKDYPNNPDILVCGQCIYEATLELDSEPEA